MNTIVSVTRLVIALALLLGRPALAQTPAALPAPPQVVAPAASDWRKSYAHALGTQAFVVGFPWVLLPDIRHKWVAVDSGKPSEPYAPLGRFILARSLTNADYRDGGSPNNETLYSIAWLDLSKGPVILSHPDMGKRYFSFEMALLDSDYFAYVGKRTTGS